MFWYGVQNKHPKDCSDEEIFYIMDKYCTHIHKIMNSRIRTICDEIKKLGE